MCQCAQSSGQVTSGLPLPISKAPWGAPRPGGRGPGASREREGAQRSFRGHRQVSLNTLQPPMAYAILGKLLKSSCPFWQSGDGNDCTRRVLARNRACRGSANLSSF